MRLVKLLAILFAFAIIATAGQGQGQSQDSQPAFYDTGNTFLSHCDENSAAFAQLSPNGKLLNIAVCNIWVLGIRQGIEMTQQDRPEPVPVSPGAVEANKGMLETLEKAGIKPSFSYPSGNLCIPESVTINQLRMGVIQWMKANPTSLDSHAAQLVYAALKNTYVCPTSKTK